MRSDEEEEEEDENGENCLKGKMNFGGDDDSLKKLSIEIERCEFMSGYLFLNGGGPSYFWRGFVGVYGGTIIFSFS